VFGRALRFHDPELLEILFKGLLLRTRSGVIAEVHARARSWTSTSVSFWPYGVSGTIDYGIDLVAGIILEAREGGHDGALIGRTVIG
jgi:hypothetical protein